MGGRRGVEKADFGMRLFWSTRRATGEEGVLESFSFLRYLVLVKALALGFELTLRCPRLAGVVFFG